MYLADLARDVAAPRRRVQLWADAGLLSSVEHPGSGCHREFSSTDVQKARALNLLSDLGISIGMQAKLVDYLLKDLQARSTLEHLRAIVTQFS